MRRAAKRDANELEIMDALRAVGATILQINETNAADLLVGFRDLNFVIEVKDGKYAKLSEGQQEWHDSWQGQRAVVRSIEEALQVIGAIE